MGKLGQSHDSSTGDASSKETLTLPSDSSCSSLSWVVAAVVAAAAAGDGCLQCATEQGRAPAPVSTVRS